jgi:hypothetical protein
VDALKSLVTGSAAEVAGITVHSIEDLKKIESFIRDVIQARSPS